jgi:hypothetical protein
LALLLFFNHRDRRETCVQVSSAGQTRAAGARGCLILGLKQQGVTADEAGWSLTAEIKTKYPDWPNTNVTNFVKSIYAE